MLSMGLHIIIMHFSLTINTVSAGTSRVYHNGKLRCGEIRSDFISWQVPIFRISDMTIWNLPVILLYHQKKCSGYGFQSMDMTTGQNLKKRFPQCAKTNFHLMVF